MSYSAKFNVKHESEYNGASIFEGSLNIYFKDVLVDSFSVMSGKWGKGALPFGEYLISSPRVLEDIPAHNSFKKEGVPWICNLSPQFQTDRVDLCIHPDGGIYGTLGCVGVQARDMRLLYILQEAFKTTTKIPLLVEKFVA